MARAARRVAGTDDIDPSDLDGQAGGIEQSSDEAGDANLDASGTATITPGEGTGPKRRGRPPGSRNGDGGKRRAKIQGSLAGSVDQLSRMILYSHVGLAAALSAPELVLTEDEAKAITAVTVNMMEVFEVKPNPKVEAVAGFAMTVIPIYATKAFQIRNRRRKDRAAKRDPVQGAPQPKPNGAAHPQTIIGEAMDLGINGLGGVSVDERG